MDLTHTHMTTQQVADRLNISVKALANMRAAGKGPRYLKVVNRVRYPVDEVKRWEQMNLRSNTGEG